MRKHGKILVDEIGPEAAHGLYARVVTGALGIGGLFNALVDLFEDTPSDGFVDRLYAEWKTREGIFKVENGKLIYV